MKNSTSAIKYDDQQIRNKSLKFVRVDDTEVNKLKKLR